MEVLRCGIGGVRGGQRDEEGGNREQEDGKEGMVMEEEYRQEPRRETESGADGGGTGTREGQPSRERGGRGKGEARRRGANENFLVFGDTGSALEYEAADWTR